VEHLDDILRNGRLFHERWGEWPMAGWLEEFEQRGLVRRVNGHWEREPSGPVQKESTA
jgi:N-acetylglucosaminyl-diphospho-decaprenol L-rhamnosyltransferase